MSGPAIEANGLWKKFHRGERHDSLRDLVPALAGKLVGRGGPASTELRAGDFWAVQDVSFQVQPGEALGIIGPNGAGKSTMLKLLNRILRPTRGDLRLNGRVAALIEVAAGFHLDLTGRENVYLQGAIMGMKRREVDRQMASIIDFAGVERAIDTPVKRYSSGMNARLGFSIAAHLEPDIMLIDEVLSVGDMAFQEKCVQRMKEFKRSGVAIVFVSHNLQAVSDLCDRALFVQSSPRALGPVQDVLAEYLQSFSGATVQTGTGPVAIGPARLMTLDGATTDAVVPGTPLVLEVTYESRETLDDIHFGFVAYRSTDGLIVYDGNFEPAELGITRLEAGVPVTMRYALNANLTRGQYHLECHVFHNALSRHVGRLTPAAMLRVDETRTHSGVADLGVQVLETAGV